MTEKIYNTRCGDIHYWINMEQGEENPTLIFLPGLTADHRLFEKQIEYFEGKNNIFVWDAPAHGKSWPFSFDFSLMDKAKWLDGIMCNNGEMLDSTYMPIKKDKDEFLREYYEAYKDLKKADEQPTTEEGADKE